MASINVVCVSGNLTRDPELRASAGGTAVLSIPLAVNDRRKNPQSGEWEDHPNYVDVVAFGRRAESLGGLLSKGSKVSVQGKLRYSSWETADGQRRSKLEVVADEVVLMSVAGQAGGRRPRPQADQQPELYDDDIPF